MMLLNHSKEIRAWGAFGYFLKEYDKLKFLQ